MQLTLNTLFHFLFHEIDRVASRVKCFIKFKSRNNILSYHYHSRPLHSVLICIILNAYFLIHIINIGILANKLTFLPFFLTNRYSGGTKVHFSLFVLSLCKLHAMQFFTWLIPIARCEKQNCFSYSWGQCPLFLCCHWFTFYPASQLPFSSSPSLLYML